jgi:hypothetical protein
MRLSIIAAMVLAAGSQALAPARAVPPTAEASKPDEATVAEAVRLLDVDGFDDDMMHSTDLVMGVSLAAMVDQMHKQYGDALPADFMDQLRRTIHDHAMATMRTHLPDVKRQIAEMYAQEFTRDELIHLRQLHEDPVAIKARQRAKEMQPKLLMIGVRTMQAAQPELDAEIKRMVSDYIATHGKSGGSSS